MAAPASDTRGPSSTLFLPDFCESRAVLAVVLIVELVAMMFAISRQALHDNFWLDLAGSSLFLLWIGLSCAAVLCRTRNWLHTLPAARASLIAIMMLLGCIFVIAELVYQIGRWWSLGVPGVIVAFPTDHAGFLLRSLGVGFIVSALALRYFYVSAEWKRSIEMEALSRIRALQARIRPHFLFNSMNTIAALTRSDPKRAEEAVEDLADLFRATLRDSHNPLRLKEELELSRIYQRIEALRLGPRLHVRWDVGALPMRAFVPGLTVQPLLENAIYHGIEPLESGGTVTVSGRVVDGEIELVVSNPIASDGSPSEPRAGNRLALDNIRQRLDLAYGGRGSLTVDQQPDRYRVTLRFPYTE